MEKDNKINPAMKNNPSTKPGVVHTYNPPSDKNKGAGIAVVIFLSVLAVLLAGGSALLLRQYLSAKYEAGVNAQQVEVVSSERDRIKMQLDELENLYATLSVDNEQMKEALAAERRRVNQLRAQLSGAPQGSGEDTEALKQEIEQLQAQLASYQSQVNLLNSEKNALASENSQMRSTLVSTTSRNQDLESRFGEMEEKLKKAQDITISSLEGIPLREKRRGDEPTIKAKKTDKINICFTINENQVATPGNRDFYVRLINPSNLVLSALPDNTFMYEGETLQYSIKRTINFQNTSQDLCLTWSQDEKYEKGYYNIVVFNEGREVGYKLFQLD